MKLLVVGAGAVGGYFGGRLIEKGADVTFLVRKGRRKQLQEQGLVIESTYGNVLRVPKMIVAGEQAGPFDLILLSTKAYHLKNAIADIRPFVTKETVILPLLNGISHYSILEEEFGEEKILGGLCFIESTLDHEGRIIQTSPVHELVFGERTGEKTDRIMRIQEAFRGANAAFRLSDNINRDLWQKYLFISVMSGITTLMRSPIGPIREVASDKINLLLNEIILVMKKANAQLPDDVEAILRKQIDGLSYGMKSSMQRDMEKRSKIEADHIHGFLREIAQKEQLPVPMLDIVFKNLKIYEKQH